MQCASAVRTITPTDAWWKLACPRTYLGGAIPLSVFAKLLFGLFCYFLEIREAPSYHFETFSIVFRKVGPLESPHFTILVDVSFRGEK